MAGSPNDAPTRATSVDASGVPTNVPAALGSVRLEHEIGRGAMGIVWLGYDRVLDRKVAVKFLLNAVADNGDPAFARFLEGARAAAAVRHGGLTNILAAGVHERTPYLMMEYVDGPTLDELLRAGGPLNVPAVLATGVRLCEAVEELHLRQIVHRDIKPSNVLVAPTGDVFASDFGLACLRPRAAGRVAGTPAYMAPETFDGTVSPRSDVYALGILLFELLTGDVPYHGELDQIRAQQRAVPLPVERLHARGVGDELIEVVERAAHRDALYRYRSAGRLLSALLACGTAEGTLAQGKRALAERVAQWQQVPAQSREPTPRDSSSYYDRLKAQADQHRQVTSIAPPSERPADVRPVDDQPVINLDLDCAQCGYNLRGLHPSGRCPECGGEIKESFFEDRLVLADRGWLRRVYLGAARLRLALLLYCAVIVSKAIVVEILATLGDWGHAISYATFITFTVQSAVLVGIGIATWAVTSAAPRAPAKRSKAPLLTARLAISVAVIWSVVEHAGAAWTAPPIADHAWRIDLPTFLLVPWSLGTWGLLAIYANLFTRVPHPKFARHARFRSRVALLWIALYAGAVLLWLVVRTNNAPGPLDFLTNELAQVLVVLLALLGCLLNFSSVYTATTRMRKCLRQILEIELPKHPLIHPTTRSVETPAAAP
jgi:serine/threonine protein kinase